MPTHPHSLATAASGTARGAIVSFWVYENWQAGPHKAVIHAGSCGFCKEGLGRSGRGTDPAYGRWLGPFNSQDEAVARAESFKRLELTVHRCCGGAAQTRPAQAVAVSTHRVPLGLPPLRPRSSPTASSCCSAARRRNSTIRPRPKTSTARLASQAAGLCRSQRQALGDHQRQVRPGPTRERDSAV